MSPLDYLLVAIIFCIGVAGLYIFMRVQAKGYKDDNDDFIVMPHRRKD